MTVIVDTSGSMEQNDLALALGVIGNALRSLPDPRGLRVLAGDTAVACAKNVFRPEQIELSGGGGTDMAAMIVAACEERPVTQGDSGRDRRIHRLAAQNLLGRGYWRASRKPGRPTACRSGSMSLS